jgi:hypothetical protein
MGYRPGPMMRRTAAWISALTLLGVAGCKTDGPLPAWAGGTGTAAPATTDTAPTPPTAGGDTAPTPSPATDEKKPDTAPVATGGDSVGVPECDTMLSEYKKCTDSLPEATRAPMVDGYKQMVDGFKQAAATPEGKGQLVEACKQAAQGMKESFKALGCSITVADSGGAEPAPANGGSFGAPPAGGSVFEKIGVEECDNYLAKYEKCVNTKFPEAARKQSLDAMLTNSKSWKDLAKSDSGRQALAAGCKQADEQTKQLIAQFNCEW